MTNSICTLAEIKNYLVSGGVSSPIDDDLLLRLSDSALAFMQNFTSRNILSATYTIETYNGNDSKSLALRNFPITSVTSVQIDGIPIQQASSAMTFGYVFDDQLVYLRGYRFWCGVQNVGITYTAGYASVPEDWKAAHIETIASAYRKKDHLDLSAISTNGITTVSYMRTSVPLWVQDVMNHYRRVTING